MKRDDRSKIIYIAGCGHSGSTLLDLLLSTHPDVCGLDEARMLVDDDRRPQYTANAHDRICSCGKAIDRCAIWSPFLKQTQRTPNESFGKRYAMLLDIVRDVVGPDTVICDSSKHLPALHQLLSGIRKGDLHGIRPDDLLVVHLVKDARAYTTSMKYRYDLPPWSLPKWFYKWYNDNREISRFLREGQSLASMQVTYEQLCFNPNAVLKSILSTADLPFYDQTGSLGKAEAHIGLGNPMRSDESKSRNIVYDSRWFHEPLIQAFYYLIPQVRSYNEALGTSNLHNQ